MNRIIVFFLLFIFSSKLLSAITISGLNSEYAGLQIVFYNYSDPVTKNKKEKFTIRFDTKGTFSSDVSVSAPTFVFAEFGIYKGMLFLEPNKSIELLFPSLREKTFADKKNPFFEPISFWFNTKNKAVTNEVARFDIRFNQLTNKYFNRLYFRQSKEVFDSVVYYLNTDFPKTDIDFFEIHKKLKIEALEADVFRLRPETISETISDINPEFWNQPSFIDFFEKVFNNKLGFDTKDIHAEELKKAVGKSDLVFIHNYIHSKYKLKGSSIDLALLKMLHDAFYAGEFSKEIILKMLESKSFTENKNVRIQEISAAIYAKLIFLQPGTIAPDICLTDSKGQKFCTNTNSDKFKYLVFADAEMVVCREHLKQIAKINEKFNKYLEIFIILRDTKPEEIERFMKENNISGIHLLDKENSYSKMYRIKSFPTSFLLNEQHEIVLAETKSPLDGFEMQFGKYLQNELFQRQRN